jgi:enoyl-[acyl-carrier protein] reductase II
MNNVICEMLDIKYPIFQGGMAWVAEARLAAAVSNAGGLGIIAAANAPASWVLEQIELARTLTNKPFGVNVMLMSPHVDEVMGLLVKNPVKVVTTGAGNPAKFIPELSNVGTRVIPVVSATALAKKMEKSGAAAVIAEGCESGGHIGEMTTMTLVPQVVDAVSIPVIAAGGIADRRGVRAAFALGASGVQLGTRFVCSTECTVHENAKQMIIGAKDRDAIVTGRFTGHPVRCLKNKFSLKIKQLEEDGVSLDEFEKFAVGSLKNAYVGGDTENGSFMAGQISGLIHDILPCEKIIEELMSE